MPELTLSLSVREGRRLDVLMAGLCYRGCVPGWLCAPARNEILLQAVGSLHKGQRHPISSETKLCSSLGL